MKDIFLSIIIPTYNRGDYILGTISSILDQDYRNFEIIIVDDGSTDNTEELVKSIYGNKIRYYRKDNEERAIARNFGINEAKGDYLTFLDSDDRLYPHYFSEALRLIETYNTPEWLHLSYEIKDQNGKILRRENNRKGNINRTLVTGNHLSCIGVFLRNDIIREYQFNEDPDIIGSEDYILWMKLSCRYTLRYSNKTCACMVHHKGRSVENYSAFVLQNRIKKSIEYIIDDPMFKKTYGKEYGRFLSHRHLYLSLHLAIQNEKMLSIKNLIRSVDYHMPVLLTRKFLVILSKYFS